jgi:Skp family chaperone for outer membrane proteins
MFIRKIRFTRAKNREARRKEEKSSSFSPETTPSTKNNKTIFRRRSTTISASPYISLVPNALTESMSEDENLNALTTPSIPSVSRAETMSTEAHDDEPTSDTNNNGNTMPVTMTSILVATSPAAPTADKSKNTNTLVFFTELEVASHELNHMRALQAKQQELQALKVQLQEQERHHQQQLREMQVLADQGKQEIQELFEKLSQAKKQLSLVSVKLMECQRELHETKYERSFWRW